MYASRLSGGNERLRQNYSRQSRRIRNVHLPQNTIKLNSSVCFQPAKMERLVTHDSDISERQKVTRKLKQTKKALESASDKPEKKKLSSELEKLRVDLNYILVSRPGTVVPRWIFEAYHTINAALPQTQEIYLPIPTRSPEKRRPVSRIVSRNQKDQ